MSGRPRVRVLVDSPAIWRAIRADLAKARRAKIRAATLVARTLNPATRRKPHGR